MIRHFWEKLVNTALATLVASAFFYSAPPISMVWAGDDVILGRALFKRMWAQSPASTQTADGLGPLFNARACSVCHKDGRKGTIKKGKYPRLLFRLNSEPVYGSQFQPAGVTGISGEGEIEIKYTEVPYIMRDGTVVNLRTPAYTVQYLNYGDMVDSKAISPRSAPTLRGVSMLAKISDEDILKKHDPMDADDNGISGRAHKVVDLFSGKMAIGRFGWKAIHPTIRQQNAGAAMGDLGISTPLFPKGSGECTDNQIECLAMPSGNSPQYDNLELPANLEAVLLVYVESLRPDKGKKIEDGEALAKGKVLFNQVGCNACHTPSYTVEGKMVYPYTDLLLHDMGARLADTVQEHDAKGSEWKTPALWGNAKKTRRSKPYFLHDGRARNILEAILWHGGEADASRTAFEELNKDNRDSIIKFVESL